MRPNPFASVSEDVLLKIFRNLEPVELCNSVLPVCSRWLSVGLSEPLWQNLAIENVTTKKQYTKVNEKGLIDTVQSFAMIHTINLPKKTRYGKFNGDKIVSYIAESCPLLTRLSIQYFDLSGVICQTLADNCKRITRLEFSTNRLHNLMKLRGLESLTYLDVRRTNGLKVQCGEDAAAVSHTVISFLLTIFPKLTNLHLLDFLMHPSLIAEITRAYGKNLKSFAYMFEFPAVLTFRKLDGACPNIDNLSIRIQKLYRRHDFHELRRFRNLRYLKIKCSVDNAKCIQRVLSERNSLFEKLVSFKLTFTNFENDTRGDDVLIGYVVYACRNLKRLSLKGFEDATDDSLPYIFKRLPMIRYLKLDEMGIKVTSRHLVNIETLLPTLRCLKIKGCDGVDCSLLKYNHINFWKCE